MRRFGEPPRRGISYRDRPGAYAVLAAGADLLMTEQLAPFAEFQLPGGGIDAGESALQALHREVFEETGWRISVTARLGVYQRWVYMEEYGFHARKVCHIYLARPVRRHGPPREDFHRAVWTPVRDAPGLLACPGNRYYAARFAQVYL